MAGFRRWFTHERSCWSVKHIDVPAEPVTKLMDDLQLLDAEGSVRNVSGGGGVGCVTNPELGAVSVLLLGAVAILPSGDAAGSLDSWARWADVGRLQEDFLLEPSVRRPSRYSDRRIALEIVRSVKEAVPSPSLKDGCAFGQMAWKRPPLTSRA